MFKSKIKTVLLTSLIFSTNLVADEFTKKELASKAKSELFTQSEGAIKEIAVDLNSKNTFKLNLDKAVIQKTKTATPAETIIAE
ncbi:hypothetical protein [Catenovulum maritimum]|uniref:Uncharacterized protein n=1 Tax=Catenovulum maritimum TaxID=1513271 RepID=A0A0J8GR00_9ALTE|nr:hypothetical protein [Catenovulum maritimum]KMT65255.1 hypothetical protein XM47_09445 [Catenovulum maritimum]